MKTIDRRALFASGAAAALLAAAGLAPGHQPRRGGRLRVALAREGDSMGALLRGAVFDTLTEVAPDGVLRGELASHWQGSADARHWEFTLRSDARFHDGTAFSATDAAASLTLPESARVETPGPDRLIIELAEANPHLPYHLAHASQSIGPGGDLSDGIGTGLYALRRFAPERHFLAERVQDHHRGETAGWADAVDAVTIPDAEVRADALREGIVDIAELPAPDGLRGHAGLRFFPSAEDMALATRDTVGIPRTVSPRAPLDDGRLAERWWVV